MELYIMCVWRVCTQECFSYFLLVFFKTLSDFKLENIIIIDFLLYFYFVFKIHLVFIFIRKDILYFSKTQNSVSHHSCIWMSHVCESWKYIERFVKPFLCDLLYENSRFQIYLFLPMMWYLFVHSNTLHFS